MAARGEDLNVRLTAKDDASKVVDKLADKVADLEDSEHETRLTADDQASDEVRALDRRLDDLTDEERQVVLEVAAKKAQREVDALTRKLADAHKYDDDEIRLIIDARGQAVRKLDTIRDELKSLPDDAADAGKGIGDRLRAGLSQLPGRFGDLGGQLAGKLAGAFAAVGVGALMAEAVARGWEESAGRRKITAQFNLTAEEAGRFGKIAGELYADNWGESIPQLQQVVATAAKRIGDLTTAELRTISEQVVATADTWDQDFNAVIRSVSQLLQNNLAPDAQAAMDLVVGAFQQGGDEAGDLLDTIDEYSQHWAALGLSGEDALGQIIHGFQNGQRDADKMADAIKEMRVRVQENSEAVRVALFDIGLDADRINEAFLAGGPAAREAFLEVVAALQRGQAAGDDTANAVAIIGEQFNDLGPKALESLAAVEDGLEDVEGAAARAAAQVGQVNPWEDIKRDAETGLAGLGRALAGGVDRLFLFGNRLAEQNEDVAESLDEVAEAEKRAATATKDYLDPIAEATKALAEKQHAEAVAREEAEEHAEALRDGADEATYTADAHDELATITDLVAEATDRKREADFDAQRAAENYTRALDRQRDAQREVYDATRSNFSVQAAARRAVNDASDAVAEFTEVSKTSAAGSREWSEALDDAALAIIDAAEATADARINAMEMNGEVVTAADKQRIFREELNRNADALAPGGALRAQLNGYIDDVNRIPREVTTVVRFTQAGQIANTYQGGELIRVTDTSFSQRKMLGVSYAGAEGAIVNRQIDGVTLGEAGREAVIPLDEHPGASPLPGGLGGGNIYLTVHADTLTNGNDVGRKIVAVLTEAKRNGTQMSFLPASVRGA